MRTNLPPSIPKPSTDVRFTGAVYTPQTVAAALVDKVGELIGSDTLRVLEPSVGDGAFVRAIRQRWAGDHLTLLDVDEGVIAALEKDEQSRKTNRATLHARDFIGYATELIQKEARPFDVVIGNPPFIRSRNFSPSFKFAVDDLSAAIGYLRPAIKNSWTAFLAASAELVGTKGVVAFVLPYEVMTVAYGQAALKRLALQFRRIDLYVSREKAFPEIDQDAIILIAQKGGEQRAGTYVNRVDRLSDLTGAVSHALDLSAEADHPLELNAYLLPEDAVATLRLLRKRCHRLDHYAGSAPGIVSAANEFFILKRADIERLGFGAVARPILKKGSIATHKPVFTATDFERVAARDPAYILRLKGPRSELSQALQDYLDDGEEAGYDLRYKCRKRPNWYEVPFVPKEDAFFFKRAHSYPRLYLNEADVYLTDTAYGLRIQEGFTARGLCFSFYNSLTLLFAETDGRFYGGGVLELSPTEFRGLPIAYHEPTDEEFSAFLEAHEAAAGDPAGILDFGDRWLAEDLGLDRDELRQLREAWSAVRSHRLRHSGRAPQVADATSPSATPLDEVSAVTTLRHTRRVLSEPTTPFSDTTAIDQRVISRI